MCGAMKTPGPTNQKSVPGLAQRVAARLLSRTCSASKPLAIAPAAWITTPPAAGTVATGWPGGAGLGVAPLALAVVLPRAGARTGRTPVTDRAPGWVTVASGAPPAAWPRGGTTARPDPVAPRPAMS